MTDSEPEPRTPPEGFQPLKSRSPFVQQSGAFFIRRDEGGATVGCWIDKAQLNAESAAHGGFMLTFADFALSQATEAITVNLSMDFMRPARLGDWIEAEIRIRKSSRTLVFADALIESNGLTIGRATAVLVPFVSGRS